ncbi:MAG: aldo/keto reductase [Magnetovibrionaceae bacterium]
MAYRLTRRSCLKALGLSAGALALRPWLASASEETSPFESTEPLLKKIPATGEMIPAIGMGTWITFNIGSDPIARASRLDVLKYFFDAGGGMIDSSPMYGSAEEVLGDLLSGNGNLSRTEHPGLFAATKVWTSDGHEGPNELKRSQALWQVDRFDLLQVHNLLAWEAHLQTLYAMKEAGRVRYVGITTSHGRRHGDMERIMTKYPLDFVQFTYNAVDRKAEDRLLPLAREKGIAVIANRPFQRGALINRVADKPLPDWAAEIGATNWAQVLLTYIVSHPDVTTAIPATSKPNHMVENMLAARGPLPDAAFRSRMAADILARV